MALKGQDAASILIGSHVMSTLKVRVVARFGGEVDTSYIRSPLRVEGQDAYRRIGAANDQTFQEAV